ncbi:MAG: bifunctional aldolase/short-chain dehydrogenase [Terriglobia bacterium]|jgi:rhamnose utilization protein RhaD (predicted bifunctional aldolase and dehydrogenase)/NAD(P)-dependent dehydrogenase (short-subunit alcohol dehydrogenase family)
MKNRWSHPDADQFIAQYAAQWGSDLALRTYTTRLLGSEEALVLHGGGNTSLKGIYRDVFGQAISTLFMKASGFNLGTIQPEGHTPLDLGYLKRLCALPKLSDDAMASEFQMHRLVPNAAAPSIETLSHAYLPAKYIDHTHADAILVLTNQPEGDKLIREALGEGVALVDYVKPGFKLAKAVIAAYDAHPGCHALVWMQHGIMTWGQTACDAYSAMIDLVTRAEEFATRRASKPLVVVMPASLADAEKRLATVAPVVRGLLAQPSGDPDRPYLRMVLQPLVNQEILDFLGSDRGKELALTPTLTSDHLVRTKALPMWVEDPDYSNPAKLREQILKGIEAYAADYQAYLARNAALMPPGMKPFDSLPRVVLLPGLGALCAGKDARAARIARDITAQTLAAKARIAAMGTYRGLAEDHLFEVEYFTLQHAKLPTDEPPLGREVALVTGAAGAIGSAIADGLLESGCHVALTDLPGAALDNLGEELKNKYGERVITAPLDVTSPASVTQGFEAVMKTWGGIDLVIVNAGVAMVSSLEQMDLAAFQRTERVNTEGALLLLRESVRHFRVQGTGGDIILVSTKNVFMPGAKFGAYSATKAAAHQLARIASQEMAELGVRVNMVAPDAVFSHGSRRSGLWAEVGPDRMRARGLDEKGLEEYYRSRNLLKAAVTAEHVSRAVLFFATRQTPTTGATIPVDGGLPDSTPR